MSVCSVQKGYARSVVWFHQLKVSLPGAPSEPENCSHPPPQNVYQSVTTIEEATRKKGFELNFSEI